MRNSIRILGISIVLCLIVAVISFAQGIKIKPVPKTEKKTEEMKTEDKKDNKDEKKPAKTYDLKPVFKKDMSWDESVTFVMTEERIRNGVSTTGTGTFKFTTKVKFTEFKDKSPKKIKYDKIKGTTETPYSIPNGEPKTRTREFKDGMMECEIDSNYMVKVVEKKKFKDDYFMFYPPGPFFGFVPPANKVKVGDTWESKSILAFSKNNIKDGDVEFKKAKGKFKLVSVKKVGKIEVAEISWIGSVVVSEGGRDESNCTWQRTIKFDLNNKLTLNNEGYFKVTMEDKGGITIKISQEFKHPKSKETKKDESVPDKPKGEDDDDE